MSALNPAPFSRLASAAASGLVGIAAQTFGGAKTFAALLTATLGVVTNLVRAVGASLVLRSDVGASSSDVAVKVGTSVSDGSVHANAEITGAYTGLGGTEVRQFAVRKGGNAFFQSWNPLPGAAGSASQVMRAESSGWVITPGGGNGSYIIVPSYSSISHPVANSFSATGTGINYIQAALSGAAARGVRIGVSAATPNASARLASFGHGASLATEDAYVTARGTYGIAGTLALSPTPGDITINAAKGRACVPAATANKIVVTNDQVTADSVVVPVFETSPVSDSDGSSARVTVTPNNGSFTIHFRDSNNDPTTLAEDTYFRFVVFQ